jgi:aminopeptidase N
MKLKLIITAVLFIPFLSKAQLGEQKKKFTREDTIRGSLNENRDWWDVLRYDIEVRPDYEKKEITGNTKIVFTGNKDEKLKKRYINALLQKDTFRLQLDLQKPLIIDSIIGTKIGLQGNSHGPMKEISLGKRKLSFSVDGNVIILDQPQFFLANRLDSIIVYYHGKPKEAKKAPWDGGWIWKKDSLGRPWMSVAVQGLGASAWYPCKDHQSDEPDNGASLTVIVPDTLVAVANGRLNSEYKIPRLNDTVGQANSNLTAYRWEVKNPINNYNIVPYIGKYVNWEDTLREEDVVKVDGIDLTVNDTVHITRTQTLNYWVLDYNLEKSQQQFQQVKPMLRCFEYWFGPYPFYEDGYKLVDAPHLGMEHQSAVAYGNRYRNGYLGRDLSGSGWGAKWDYIIIHESGHEWFGNNITTNDIADMWVHEGFTCYSETLYTEWLFGKQAGDEYNRGLRKNIENDKPVIGPYGVNEEGSGDMYFKGANMLHTIRKVINDDSLFRKILRGLNETFRHKTVTTQDIESYIIKESGINFQKTFDQYLRTTQIPVLEFYFKGKKVHYRWANCIKGFDLPLVINNKRYSITTKWKSASITGADRGNWNKISIEQLYYITAKQAKP